MSVENKVQPLVSIVVITYNSSKYVRETLESAKTQTYQNIELIVTDDSSTDDTVEICRLWIEDNKDCFVHTKLIIVDKNTGIAPNCNRGLNASTGEWVKFIAGDDVLLPDCIDVFVNFANTEKDCEVLFAQHSLLEDNKISKSNSFNEDFFKLSAQQQLKHVIKGVSLSMPAAFFKRDLLNKLGGFDERYPLMEDVPFYLKISQNSHKIYGVNSIVVLYRQHNDKVSGVFRKNYINLKFYKSKEKFLLEKMIPIFINENLFLKIFNIINMIFVSRTIILLGNKNNAISKLISYLYIDGTIGSIKRVIRRMKIEFLA